MDAAEAREERVKAKAARDEAHAKYDAAAAQVPLPPNLAALEKIKYEADVAYAQANLDLVKAQVPRNEEDVADAKVALVFAREQLDKLTSAAAAPAGLSTY